MLNIRASQILAPHNLLAKKINSIVGADESDNKISKIRHKSDTYYCKCSKGIKIGKLIINDSRALFQPRLHPQHEPSA